MVRDHGYLRRVARWWRWSWTGSSLLHAGLVVFLASDLAAMLLLLLGIAKPPVSRPPIEIVARLDDEPQEPPPAMLVAVEPYDSAEAFAAAEAVAGRLDFSDPALQRPLDYDSTPDAPPDAPVEDVSQLIRRGVDAAIAQANQQSTEENLDRLDQLAQQLDKTSTDASVSAVVGTIGNVLGLQPRATAPSAEPVAGVFDSNSAQPHDVVKLEREDGTVVYKMILIDAAGRQLEVELSAAEGETAYNVFEKMKRYPFLDKIYRSVVMSIMDGVLSQPR